MESMGPGYGQVHKVLNNNLIIAVDAHGREVVMMGRGLGWSLKVHDDVDPNRVEKTYVLDQETDQERWQRFLADAPYSVVEAVTSAVEEASVALGNALGRSLPIALIDHVCFLMERLERGVELPSAPMPELAVLHPQEFKAARRMRERLVEELGLDLPGDEASYLTLHLLNASREDSSDAAGKLSRQIGHIVSLVEAGVTAPIDPSTPDYARFVLHLKFLLQRLSARSAVAGGGATLYEAARRSYPRSSRIAVHIQEYLHDDLGLKTTDEELLYLIIHVERLTHQMPDTSMNEA